MKYFLGLDAGGTYTKAVIFNSRGEKIAGAGVTVPSAGNASERDPDVFFKCACNSIKASLDKSGLGAADISAVGISGHGKGLYTLSGDKELALPGILSIDDRAADIVKRWENDGTAEKAAEIGRQRVLACQPVAILNWFKSYDRKRYDAIKCVFSAKDFLRYRLTGKAAAELTDASGSFLLDLKSKRYDERLYRLFGIEEIKSALPKLIECGDTAGYITEEAANLCGLKSGTPVSGGLFDIDAAGLGVGMTDSSVVTVISGTWSINQFLSKEPCNEKVAMNSVYAINEYYLAEECSPTGAGNLEWVLSEIAGSKDYEEINSAVESAPFDPDLVFLPYLYGRQYEKVGGGFINLTAQNTKDDMLRAVYEGVAFAHRIHYERLLCARDKPRALRLAGGAAKSKVWTRIFADVLKTDLEVISGDEPGALGAAITAAVAAGEYADLLDAVSKMVRIGDVVKPDADNTVHYDEKYERFKKIVAALESV